MLKRREILSKGLPIVLCLLFAVSCSKKTVVEKDPAVAKSIFSGECIFERIDWMEASADYKSSTLLEIASGLKAAVEADVKKIEGFLDGSLKAGADKTLKSKQFVNGEVGQKHKVSQEFWEEYLRQRTATCTLQKAISGDVYGDDKEALTEARKIFNNAIAAFAKIEEKEKKNLKEN